VLHALAGPHGAHRHARLRHHLPLRLARILAALLFVARALRGRRRGQRGAGDARRLEVELLCLFGRATGGGARFLALLVPLDDVVEIDERAGLVARLRARAGAAELVADALRVERDGRGEVVDGRGRVLLEQELDAAARGVDFVSAVAARDGAVEVREGAAHVVAHHALEAARGVEARHVGSVFDGLVDVGERALQVALEPAELAAPLVRLGVVGLERDGLVQLGEGAVQVARCDPLVAAPEVLLGVALREGVRGDAEERRETKDGLRE
jgi:hypothetical protein